MARGDDALTCLRKAERKLREVQRNLAEATHVVMSVSGSIVMTKELVEIVALYDECTRLKERVIAQYEAMGGTWEGRSESVVSDVE